MSLSNEDENSRKIKIEEIIHGCYQNEYDISSCVNHLSLQNFSLPTEGLNDLVNRKKIDNVEVLADKNYRTMCFKYLPVYPENNQLFWKQGSLGSCWAIAAFNVFLMNETYKRKVIKEKDDGSVEVHLVFNGVSKPQKVEAIFPIDTNNQLIYASGSGASFAPLIEKAMAMLNGSYTSLKSGFMNEGKEIKLIRFYLELINISIF